MKKGFRAQVLRIRIHPSLSQLYHYSKQLRNKSKCHRIGKKRCYSIFDIVINFTKSKFANKLLIVMEKLNIIKDL